MNLTPTVALFGKIQAMNSINCRKKRKLVEIPRNTRKIWQNTRKNCRKKRKLVEKSEKGENRAGLLVEERE